MARIGHGIDAQSLRVRDARFSNRNTTTSDVASQRLLAYNKQYTSAHFAYDLSKLVKPDGRS